MSVSDQNNSQMSLVRSLPPLEQFLLTFISVIYEPVSPAFLGSCLAGADIPGLRRLGGEELEGMVSRLRELGLLNEFNQCPHLLAEQLTRQAAAEGRFTALADLIELKAPVSYLYGKWSTRCRRALRQFRIGLHSGDIDKMEEAAAFLKEQCKEEAGPPPAVQVVAETFDADWFKGLPGFLQFYLLNEIFRHAGERAEEYPAVTAYLEQEDKMLLSEDERVPFRRLLAGHYLLRGSTGKLDALLAAQADSFQGSGFAGSAAFLRGRTDEAIQLFETDLALLNKYAGPEGAFFFNISGVFCIMALLARNSPGDRELIRRAAAVVLSRCQGGPEELAFRFLDLYVAAAEGGMPDLRILTEGFEKEERSLSILTAGLVLHWLSVHLPDKLQVGLESLCRRAKASGFLWLAMEAAQLLAAADPSRKDMAKTAEKLTKEIGCRSVTGLITPGEDSWKQSLEELISVTGRARQSEKTSRLAWTVEFVEGKLTLAAKEQKKKPGSKWSKGKGIGLNRLLYSPNDFDFLTEQDTKICTALRQVGDPNSRNGGCDFDMDKALPALVGHPQVLLENSGNVPVEIVAGEPELMVEEQDGFLFVHFLQEIGEGRVTVWQETPTRFRVMEINDEHRRVAGIIGSGGKRYPAAAGSQVLSAIGNMASFMTVHSSIDVGGAEKDVKIVEADPTMHIHIIPYGSGFRLEMFVQPFSRKGPYLKPGTGVANLMAEVGGRRMQTRRNLLLEEEKAREIEESCPILDLATDLAQENDREWHLLDPEECLQALLELEEIRDRAVLEWPEGEKLAVRRQAGISQLNLNIRTGQQDWFALSGHVQVDQDEIIDLKTLLDKVREARSRFIPLGKGQFLALTQEFRSRLEELLRFSEAGGKGEDGEEEIRIHPLAALALDDLTRQANTQADEGWQKQLARIEFVQDFVPEVPSTLQAELRDYQVEGFVWMSRLAHLGVGGCLADDMGLGKTLQSLAVILDRTKDGPTLVIAPTSVCMNWEQEAARFAPTLTVRSLANAEERKEVIRSLGKRDILITSFTLLQQEVELLETVPWQTVVLDEAQSIKNAATKRSKAAMRLKAKFRLITTGTPIENHLGELWNLFNFINPGLLGTYKQFNTRFGIPIEKHGDRTARRQLKKLIRPFMLRRIKSQVLDELPPRTEITLRVEMKKSEMAFYEAIRQQALENIEGSEAKSGRHLQILAEIMRLRRACCNSKLIDDSSKIPSSKLEVFGEVVEELLASRHKALVFSQFTGHLALIRAYLDGKGICYKYLDGTTPAKERIRQVDAFQAGEGDLFLISLKAGGLGLNLTAADYVIHMDPWWNPAVEDQAADRAHRIGQKRPVTVYRLVTANTIEEKIVRLHQEKRNLANSLLEGTDAGARMSAEELLDLIKGS